MNTLTVISALASALVVSAPPILPFTELNEKKIQDTMQHMIQANECTRTDMDVLLQLDHINWKYNQMRQVMYKAAQNGKDGDVINVKDLGRMFDKIDASLEEAREQDLQRIREELERKQKDALPKRGQADA